MIILSHRGYWKSLEERNREVAFSRSFSLGYGTETDVRDCAGRLLISHDAPRGEEMTVEEFFSLPGATELPQAINIKADGLTAELARIANAKKVRDWFVFDMAVPDMRAYLNAGVPVFTRMSEVERQPAWLERASGVWLDAFESTWYDTADVEALIRTGKRVCVVSPELHGRDAVGTWSMLKSLGDAPNLLLCTDRPEDASAFFGVRP